jgi:predicted ferric reductase
MRAGGLVLIIAALVAPIPWFIDLTLKYPAAEVFSLYLGSCSLIAMGMGQFLVTRVPGLETIFGAQDQLYVLHKWLAITGLICLGLHDIIDADIDGLGRETFLNDIAEDIGEIAYYGLLVLTVVTLITFVPYHMWRVSHKFVGAFFIAGAAHYAFILKPFELTSNLGLYVLSFSAVGTLSYLYLLLLYPRLPGAARYLVEDIKHHRDMTDITLKPNGRGIRHRAGQFAFISFDIRGLEESHPFTISSAPSTDGSLRFSIRPLGDYTNRLKTTLQIGSAAKVYGAFGKFFPRKSGHVQIWIGAGAGITPFLSWVGDIKEEEQTQIHLFYCVRDKEHAAYVQELVELAAHTPSLTLHIIDSTTDERLTAKSLVDKTSTDLKNAYVCFCGPKPMREAMKRDLVRFGLRASRFHYEHFEIRSGIGVLKFVTWISDLLGNSTSTRSTPN